MTPSSLFSPELDVEVLHPCRTHPSPPIKAPGTCKGCRHLEHTLKTLFSKREELDTNIAGTRGLVTGAWWGRDILTAGKELSQGDADDVGAKNGGTWP